MKRFTATFVVALLFISSCKKDYVTTEKEQATTLSGKFRASVLDGDFDSHDEDDIERITVLGSQLVNPYLLPNMQQAYQNLGITNVPVNVTDLYVRFKPADIDQLDELATYMESQDLELFDTPVDYEVIYEGDYYQDPTVDDEDITWQYAVVPPYFTFPSGIQYELLAEIHIPGDDYTAVETEAENLAGNSYRSSGGGQSKRGGGQTNVLQCEEGYHWDYSVHDCVPDDCPPGYYWNGQDCEPYPTLPPAPAPDAGVPAGGITVYDTQTFSNRPVRKARIVARRWFKIERGFTDNNGHYQLSKRFKNKVRINVKFKNDDAEIRSVRGVRLWQMLFPIKKSLGVYSGDKSSINYTFAHFTDPGSKGNKYWAGATANNSVQDYREYAVQEGIGQPPTGIKVMLTNWVSSGVTLMFNKRAIYSLPAELLTEFVYGSYFPVAGFFGAVTIVLKHQIDIMVGFQEITSVRLKETMYHELSHAAHYQALGNGWYSEFVDAEAGTLSTAFLSNTPSPYGNKSGPNSAIIALGEGWAYYLGHFLIDRQYGVNCGNSFEQGNFYANNNPVFGLNSHINLLEDFNPDNASDEFNWIPQGLFYDLIDDRDDDSSFPRRVFIVDQVDGYTNQQMFSAFKSNIRTLQDYKDELLGQNNLHPLEVSSLFNAYGY